jgi:HSP20 family protein
MATRDGVPGRYRGAGPARSPASLIKEFHMFLVPMTRDSRPFPSNLDRLFDDTLSHFFGAPAARGEAAARSPALDVAESDRGYTVKLEVPGVKKEDVKVSVEGRRITVQAQSQSTDEHKDGDRIVYRERSVSSFARSFTLPSEVDQASANAKLDQGVLTLELPKRSATATAQLTVN